VTKPVCFFAGQGPCDGALIRAHLIPRQLLKREFPHGVTLCVGGPDRRLGWYRYRPGMTWVQLRSLESLVDDPRCWVPCCGGPMGLSGHHGMLDQSRTLRIPRERLPQAVEDFAAELNLSWWLEREYGLRSAAA
jgi:hypothetical protein